MHENSLYGVFIVLEGKYTTHNIYVLRKAVMTNIEFYVSMIIGSLPLSELRKTYAKNIIKVITKNKYYDVNGESPTLDKVYAQLIGYKVKTDQAKSASQLETIIRGIDGKKRG